MLTLASSFVTDLPGHRERLGIGLGLRWEFLEDVLQRPRLDVAFWEVSPENHMRRGGYFPWALSQVRERYPLVTHGLTMSLGAVDPPPAEYLAELKAEIQRMASPWHSDHLCLSTVGPLVMHDLLPLRLSLANADRTADRLRSIQDVLGVPMAFENISWYAQPGHAELPETEFINRVLERSGCWLLLDVNNVYVNARNHHFDAYQFISELPLDRVIQLHVAGHTELETGLLLDTHGAEVCDPVYNLLRWTLERTGPRPVLLERDNNVPELDTLLEEVGRLQRVYSEAIAAWQFKQSPRSATDAQARTDTETERERAVERAYASLSLGAEFDLEDPAAASAWLTDAGVHPEDQRAILEAGAARFGIYRTLVRGNIEGAIELAMPRAIARLGRETFDQELAAWLTERGPRTHYLRDVTREFLDFCEPRWQHDPRVPAYLAELARHEALSIEIASEQSRSLNQECGELALDAPVRFIEAVRLVRYRHAVHRLSEAESARDSPSEEAISLLVYRSPEHDVRYLELTPLAASILDHLLSGDSLQRALLSGCEVLGVPLTQSVLEGTSRVLADLAERGALLGAGGSANAEPNAHTQPPPQLKTAVKSSESG